MEFINGCPEVALSTAESRKGSYEDPDDGKKITFESNHLVGSLYGAYALLCEDEIAQHFFHKECVQATERKRFGSRHGPDLVYGLVHVFKHKQKLENKFRTSFNLWRRLEVFKCRSHQDPGALATKLQSTSYGVVSPKEIPQSPRP